MSRERNKKSDKDNGNTKDENIQNESIQNKNTKNKKIFVKNIYYMLSYVFDYFREDSYEKIQGEDFEDAKELFAALLLKDISRQLKQGLYKEYIEKRGIIRTVRGKVIPYETLAFRRRERERGKIVCEFDDLSENNIWNQILKTTLYFLEREKEVTDERRQQIRKLLSFFEHIDILNPRQISWRRLQITRGNRSYEALMNLCYFVLDGLILNREDGSYKMQILSEDHMERLYEKFVLAYYRRHYGDLDEVRARQIRWKLDEEIGGDGRKIGRKEEREEEKRNQRKKDGDKKGNLEFLPVMKTDITLKKGDKILIIDTKYYQNNLQEQYGRKTIHSNNLYQIFAYVKNLAAQEGENVEVSGMLLYAKTEGENVLDCGYSMSGNWIGVRTIDLGREFEEIRGRLDEIVRMWVR